MRHQARFLIFAGVLTLGVGTAHSRETITLGKNAFAFHEEAFAANNIVIEPPVVIDVEILVELIGIPNVAKINSLNLHIRRSIGFGNARAIEHRGARAIVYDPVWAKSASAEFYLVLGHEAGHLFCEHKIGSGNQRQKELEADQFGGSAIKRFEVYHARNFFPDVMKAANVKYPLTGSPSHPSRAERIAALRKGYVEGSPCGGLAPVEQSGFSRGPR